MNLFYLHPTGTGPSPGIGRFQKQRNKQEKGSLFFYQAERGSVQWRNGATSQWGFLQESFWLLGSVLGGSPQCHPGGPRRLPQHFQACCPLNDNNDIHSDSSNNDENSLMFSYCLLRPTLCSKWLNRAFMRIVAECIISVFPVGESDTIAFNNINNQNCQIYHILWLKKQFLHKPSFSPPQTAWLR